jgi:predicted MFS family arabinose efflux permease
MSPAISERKVVFLVGAVQFVNILDFMIVMPLGPDFAVDLGIPAAQLGFVAGAYTAAAAVAGLAGSFFLDRFDRRKALVVTMLGLALGTLAAAFARGMVGLVLARLLAGAFGGPATSIALSIIADVVPPERRGKAFGAVMGAFAAASVLGVPLGLELARQGGWQLPFIAVAALGVLVTGGVAFLLPPMRHHLEQARGRPTTLAGLVARPVVRWSFLMTAVVMAAGFMLIPNLSAFLQFNLGYPRARLGLLYLVGGAFSFFALRVVGALVDRHGSFRIGTLGCIALIGLCYLWFVAPPPGLPVMPMFVIFMLSMSLRNVPYNTLTSRVPRPAERARFMSIQSAIQHLASAVGAFGAARMMTELPDRSLAGVERVAFVSMGLTAFVPLLLWTVERRVVSATVQPAPLPPAS